MSNPFHLIWGGPSGDLHGYDDSGAWQDLPLTYGIQTAGDTPPLRTITLTGSGLRGRTYETLNNTALSLDGDAATLARLDGCLSLSFDGGHTYRPLTPAWLLIPASAMGPGGVDGRIGPFETATMTVKLRLPADFTAAAPLTFRIAVDCDVV
jgi:hypothetical protein